MRHHVSRRGKEVLSQHTAKLDAEQTWCPPQTLTSKEVRAVLSEELPGAPLQNTGTSHSHCPSVPCSSILPFLQACLTATPSPEIPRPCISVLAQRDWPSLQSLVLPYRPQTPLFLPPVLADVTSINEQRARVHTLPQTLGKNGDPSPCCPFIIGGSKV